GLVQRRGLAPSFEQGAAEIRLERAHLQAHGSLRQRHPFRRRGERTARRDRDEGFEIPDAAHRSPHAKRAGPALILNIFFSDLESNTGFSFHTSSPIIFLTSPRGR